MVPESSPGCEFKFGIYPDSDTCSTSYIRCEHGYPFQTPCEPGLAYDEKNHKCNWPDELLHMCNPEGKLLTILTFINKYLSYNYFNLISGNIKYIIIQNCNSCLKNLLK